MTVILGIETSCDETAAAVVEDGRYVHSSVVSSQVDLHARFGGVVPEVASRAHVELVTPVIAEALVEAGVDLTDLDAVAACHGPGLAGEADFSFAGLKTAVVNHHRKAPDTPVADIAASFQEAVVDQLVAKLLAAADGADAPVLAIGGGVAANSRLRAKVAEAAAATGR